MPRFERGIIKVEPRTHELDTKAAPAGGVYPSDVSESVPLVAALPGVPPGCPAELLAKILEQPLRRWQLDPARRDVRFAAIGHEASLQGCRVLLCTRQTSFMNCRRSTATCACGT